MNTDLIYQLKEVEHDVHKLWGKLNKTPLDPAYCKHVIDLAVSVEQLTAAMITYLEKEKK